MTDGPYSKAAYVEEPAIPDYMTLHEKTPAVQLIRTLYKQRGWQFTRWHRALFYMTSNEDLAELKGNPEAARNYGDAAELFSVFFTTGRIPSTYKQSVNQAPPASADVATHTRLKIGNKVDERDHSACVVTNRAWAYDRAHIVPLSVNATRISLAYMPPVLALAGRLLGVSFREDVEEHLGSLGGTDRPWNVITLTPYLHRMWDAYNLVGFRPRYIDAERSSSGNVVYFATFTFHWLLDNILDRDEPVPLRLSADECFQMVCESESFKAQKDQIFEMVYIPGRNNVQRLEDGHVCRVGFSGRPGAEMMMRMLDLRWHASRLLWLSGGGGEEFLEPASDAESDAGD